MDNSSKLLSLALLSACVASGLNAQENSRKGYLTGSFETNTNYYQKDSKNPDVKVPEDQFGSNNYLKLDYYHGKFSAGVQVEAYAPVLLGYPSELEGAKFTNYYVDWTDDEFSVTAGTFYDQFGCGLLFRSWQDRALGLNNAIMGARVTYNYKNIVRLKGLWGMPRFGMEFAETQVRGLDASVSLSDLLKWQTTSLSIEGSALNRYESFDNYGGIDLKEEGGKPYSNGFSGRINLDTHGFIFKGEYVDAGNKWYASDGETSFIRKRGNAQLIELGYNANGLGINVTGRRLEWMQTNILGISTSALNMLNYVPAMCTQYTYLLTNLHPYTAETGKIEGTPGEIGGQIDVFYNFRRGTVLGGKRGLKVHANFSTYYALVQEGSAKAGNLLFRDFSFDFEKQFNRQFKLNFLYSVQEKNPTYGATKETHLSNIFVADMQYKFTPKFSTRLELQYLTTHEDEKDWMAALLEVNFAPTWSIYVSDMYNHGDTKVHYYNIGASYAKSRTRVALSYGRNREGYICSGAVCRPIPAYTGLNLSVTTSF